MPRNAWIIFATLTLLYAFTHRSSLPLETAKQSFVSVKTDTGSQCDPNYSGCVPIASDVDCAGGSGNGPAYVRGTVKVIGTDIYNLDVDGDGLACEPKHY